MLEQIEVAPNVFSRVSYAVFHTRQETIWERFNALDVLYEQLSKEARGSERYQNIFHAYRWLKRQPDRVRPVFLVGKFRYGLINLLNDLNLS